jgi:hypothetical protein
LHTPLHTPLHAQPGSLRMSAQMYVVALSPPSNIQRILSEAQTQVFQELSCAAALAIPPIVPLGFYDRRPAPPVASALVQECQLKSTGFLCPGNHIYLGLSPTNEIARIGRLIAAEPSTPLFPVLAGVPIGINLDHPRADVAWPAPLVTWKTCRLLCLELEIGAVTNWWENVTYVKCWDIKLKRKI